MNITVKTFWVCQYYTVGKGYYFTGYGILLHGLPVVVVLITQSNNDEEFRS